MYDTLTIAANARRVADLLETYPDLPAPTHVFVDRVIPEINWLIWDDEHSEQREVAQSVVKILPGTVTKTVTDSAGWMNFSGQVNGVKWEVTCARESVCVRRVVGTKEVTREVPDPSVEVPMIEVTETVEEVEWDCQPILADVEAVA